MNNKLKLGFIFILSVLLLVLLLSPKSNPNSPFFNIKRLQEKAFLNLRVSQEQKVEYLGQLLDNRLVELENLVKDESYEFLRTASLRYSTTAGHLTEAVVDNNLTKNVNPLKEKFESHKKRLQAMYEAYPKNFKDEEYKYIEDAINYLNAYLDKLSQVK